MRRVSCCVIVDIAPAGRSQKLRYRGHARINASIDGIYKSMLVIRSMEQIVEFGTVQSAIKQSIHAGILKNFDITKQHKERKQIMLADSWKPDRTEEQAQYRRDYNAVCNALEAAQDVLDECPMRFDSSFESCQECPWMYKRGTRWACMRDDVYTILLALQNRLQRR